MNIKSKERKLPNNYPKLSLLIQTIYLQVYQICGIIEQIKNRCWSTGTTITYCYKDAVRIRIQRFLAL